MTFRRVIVLCTVLITIIIAVLTWPESHDSSAAEMKPQTCSLHLDCGEFGRCDLKYHVCREVTAVKEVFNLTTGVSKTVEIQMLVLAPGGAREPSICQFPAPTMPCGYEEHLGDGDGQEFQEDVPNSEDAPPDYPE